MDIDSRLEMSLDDIISTSEPRNGKSSRAGSINGGRSNGNNYRGNKSKRPASNAIYPPASHRRIGSKGKPQDHSEIMADCGLKFLLPNYLTGSLIGSGYELHCILRKCKI